LSSIEANEDELMLPLFDISLSAAGADSVECLRYVVDQGGVPLHSYCAFRAESVGCAEVLQFLFQHGIRFSADACATAAGKGELNALKYLHEVGTTWDKTACTNASRKGHLILSEVRT